MVVGSVGVVELEVGGVGCLLQWAEAEEGEGEVEGEVEKEEEEEESEKCGTRGWRVVGMRCPCMMLIGGRVF